MADTVNAIASLLWPLLVLGGLFMFYRPVSRLLGNSEEVTLEVGGQRLTIKQLSDQQSEMIADLQRQVSELNDKVGAFHGADTRLIGDGDTGPLVRGHSEDERPNTQPAPQAVLWVDDYPSNNAILIERLQHDGVRVDIARSTDEGMVLFDRRRYGIVVSDMGRRENGLNVSDAGMRLLKVVREVDDTVPFVIYTSDHAARAFANQAREEGATAITASTTVLTEQLRLAGVGQSPDNEKRR